jgi:diguanylate cyclase (GGDEF)-like protein
MSAVLNWDRVQRAVLPMRRDLTRGRSHILIALVAVVVALLALTAANAVLGWGGHALQRPIRDWVSSAIYILVGGVVALRAIALRPKRAQWTMFAIGLSLYGLGNVLWSFWIEHLKNVPIPSVCDGLWLSLYPLSYAGIVGLGRARGQRRLAAGVWLDGIIAGAGLAAVGAALVFRPVVSSATGSPVAVITELAYPIGDLLLAALVVGVLALRGWRLNRGWGLLAGGFLLLAVADAMYAVQVANGGTSPSPMTNFFYVFAVALLMFAAWQDEDERPRHRPDGWSVLAVPGAFSLAALGLLVYDHGRALDPLALSLAVLTVAAAHVRTGITFRDVRNLSEARRQAVTDDLTLLPNRRLFVDRTHTAIAAARLTGTPLAVLVMDLDNFKQLNDTLGHHAGDLLLRQIGPRLKRSLRADDTVARLGGDEFAVLLDPQLDEKAAARVAEKLLGALHEPFEVEGLKLRITASIGIASFPAHAADANELMKRADVAMYQAKSARSGYQFYARERDTNSRERLLLAGELAAALDGGAIVAHFQPKAEGRSGRIVGVEALVRWQREDGSLLAPGAFIDAAEHAGLSRALTRRVLALALEQLAAWRRGGHDLHVAVNTTVADLLDVEFPVEVAQSLEDHGLPAEALVLEVTETSLLSDPVRIGNVLARLGELGIQLSLDDFGTGYSSLAHLRTLPVGEVKLDRSFVARMRTDDADMAIVQATVQLAHRLGMRVVAEGVEDAETWQALTELQCELIQGYALSRPVPAVELESQLQRVTNSHPSGRPLCHTTTTKELR